MNMPRLDYKGWIKTALVFGGLAFIFSKLLLMFFEKGLATVYFTVAEFDVGSKLRAGVDTSFGAKVMSVMQGVPIVNQPIITQLLTIGLSSIAVFLIGRFVLDLLPDGVKAKTPAFRLAEVATIGSIVVGLFLGLMLTKSIQIPVWTAAISTFVAFAIVSFAYLLGHKWMPKLFSVGQ